MPPLKKQILQQFGNQKLLTEFLLLRINSKKIISDYLGKLTTYLRAMQAQKAVWIVFYPRSEHIAAINWLNKSNNSDFYLLKIEAIGIGESNPAPILNLIVGSSEIRKSVGRIKQERKDPHQLLEAWFTALAQHPAMKLHKNQIIKCSLPYWSRRAET